MSYQVVARRWRPLSFADVIGQQHVTQTLANAIERDRVAHAFLFTGIRGVGKTTVARLLARALNCQQRQGAEPCNQCRSCTEMISGASVDVIEIDGASNRGIDEVRSLIEAAQYRPAGGGYRIYIIDEVHQLTGPAFNALLKILEEPPEHVKFVLATTEAHKVPTTVLSRCQRYDFRRIAIDDIRTQLAAIVEHDRLEVSAEALSLIAREADGSMRDAQSLLEQVVSAAGKDVSAGAVAELLGIARVERIASCVAAVLERDGAGVVAAVDEVRRNGYDPERFLSAVLEFLRHVTVATAAGADAVGPSVGEETAAAVARLAGKRSLLDLHRIFEALLGTAGGLRRGSMPDLVLEMGLLKAAAFEDVVSASEILARLDGAPSGPSPGSGGGGKSSSARGAPSSSPTSSGGRRSAAAQQVAAEGPVRSLAPVEKSDEAPEGGGDPELAEWERFLGQVRRHGEFNLYVMLSNCQVRILAADRWELKPILQGYRRSLEQNSMMKKVRQLASECMGHPVAVELDGSNGSVSDEGAVSAHAIERNHRARVEEAALADPVVRAALELLDGKVEKISRLDD